MEKYKGYSVPKLTMYTETRLRMEKECRKRILDCGELCIINRCLFFSGKVTKNSISTFRQWEMENSL